MNENLDILFDKYSKGNLSSNELSEFNKRLSDDKSFEEAFVLYLTLTQGLKLEGRSALKQEVADVMNNVKPQEYKPKGNSGWSYLSFFISTTFLLTTILAGLIYFDKLPVENPKIDKVETFLHQWDDKFYKYIVADTIYDTIAYEIETDLLEDGEVLIIDPNNLSDRDKEILNKFSEE